MPDSCCCTLEGGKCGCSSSCKTGKCDNTACKCGDECKCKDCKVPKCQCSEGNCKCDSGCKHGSEKSCCK
ncbi:Hypothetical predicted protein [Octopus vulgaris]|uniref:Metallothionein n=1 Tax=Octopus vulgaris TaxID=6645 RepID=A0AA36BLK1_OCTVU|nr:Hypothetical predicted protein [Octopus vulgaris]